MSQRRSGNQLLQKLVAAGRISLLLIIGLVTTGTSVVNAQAIVPTAPAPGISAEQMKIFNKGNYWFNYDIQASNCGGSGGDNTGSIALTGSDNQEKAFNYFIARGLSPAQSAGIVGNLIAESQVNPLANQTGSGIAHGIAQWEDSRGSGRWDSRPARGDTPGNVKAYAASPAGKGRSVWDMSLQLDYLWLELTKFYAPSLAKIKAANTFGVAAVTFMIEVEVPADRSPTGTNARARTQSAGEVLARYGGGAPGEGDSGDFVPVDSTCGQANSASCDLSGQVTIGKAAVLCEARKFDPYGYKWGGGHEGGETFMARWNASGGYTQPFKQVLDCSGIITVALWNVYKVRVVFSTPDMARSPYFREIPIAQSQPGDFVWHPGHVEIVSKPGATATFGAHTSDTAPERQIGDAGKQNWVKAYEFVNGAGN